MSRLERLKQLLDELDERMDDKRLIRFSQLLAAITVTAFGAGFFAATGDWFFSIMIALVSLTFNVAAQLMWEKMLGKP